MRSAITRMTKATMKAAAIASSGWIPAVSPTTAASRPMSGP